jgi:phosphatidylethanolamine/phosphatidyl-N-methylethanolamine N-methyltransferase
MREMKKRSLTGQGTVGRGRMSARTFAREFVKNWKATGAVAPSSRALAELMVGEADLGSVSAVLELGPGTGPITEVISERLGVGQCYVGVELNEVFVRELRARFPRLTFLQGAAQEVDLRAPLQGREGYDCIISGLPWTAFPGELQDSILGSVLPLLRPGGKFITFAYAGLCHLKGGRSFREKLESLPGRLSTTGIVWGNVPPAFVYVMTKAVS